MTKIQFIKPLHLSLKKYLFLKPNKNKVVSVFLIVNPHIPKSDFLKGYLLLLNSDNEIPYANKVFDNIDDYCKIDLKLQKFKVIQSKKVTIKDTDFIIYFILGNSNRYNFWLNKKTEYVWRDHYFISNSNITVNYKVLDINIDSNHILNLVEPYFKT